MIYTSILKKWIDNIGKKRLFFFISHLVYNIVLFLILITAAKICGPEEWGIITLLLLVSTYSSLFTLGINNGLGVKLPYLLGKNKYSEASEIESTSILALFLTIIPIAFIQYGFIYFWNKPIVYWFILVGYTISLQLLSYLKIRLRSYEYFGLFSLAYILQALSLSIGILGLIKGFSYLVIASVVNVLACLFIYSTFPINQFSKFKIKHIVPIIKIGFPIMAAGIVGEFLLSVDRILISIVFDHSELGYYGFSSNLFKGVRIIGVAISMIALPLIVKAFSVKNYDKMQEYAKTQQRVSFILMGLASLIVSLIAYKFIPEFIPEYKKSLVPSILLMGVATLIPLSYYPHILNTIGHQRLYLICQLFGIVMNVICSIIFIYAGFGINGIASGSLISMLCYVIFIRRKGKTALETYLKNE